MNFTENSNRIFKQAILDYHKMDHVDTPIQNPYPHQSIEYYLYLKNWIDTVQWHLEDIIRDPNINPEEALKIKRRIDKSNQDRTDLVELIDSYFLDKYKGTQVKADATINTESPAWAIDRLSILALKIYHMHQEVERTAKHNLKGAPIVIAGGYGMGSKEGFDKLFELAKELHAEVGASRAAVDAGYADHDRQIGQTGVTVRPKLYIACGISGQIQHIAGMQDAGIIISVNSDPNAPINTIADYVINGTVEEVVPKLIKYYKKNSK